MSSIIIFIATFISILAVGIEMSAIANKRVWLAVLSACIISGGQIVAFKLVPLSQNWLDSLAYVLANGFGIFVSFGLYKALEKHLSNPK